MFAPGKPIKYVSNPLLAKLSAWFIILGLRPRSPRTKIATVCTSGDSESERLRQHKYKMTMENNACGISHSKLLIALEVKSSPGFRILLLVMCRPAASADTNYSYTNPHNVHVQPTCSIFLQKSTSNSQAICPAYPTKCPGLCIILHTSSTCCPWTQTYS